MPSASRLPLADYLRWLRAEVSALQAGAAEDDLRLGIDTVTAELSICCEGDGGDGPPRFWVAPTGCGEAADAGPGQRLIVRMSPKPWPVAAEPDRDAAPAARLPGLAP